MTITIKIDYNIEGLRRIQAAIIENRIGKDIANQYVQDCKDTIQEEGPGWPELSARRIAERGSAHPILIDTGKLIGSFNVNNVGPTEYQVKNTAEYAPLHEYGGINEEGFIIPERSYMRNTLAKNESKYKALAEDKLKRILGL